MADYELDELLKTLASGDLEDEIVVEQGNYAGNVLQEEIENLVYKGNFQPNYYIRRYTNGGYGDRRNIRVRLVDKGVAMIENVTTGVGDTTDRIDNIIENGEGYTWNRQPPPRPVFEKTRQRLNNDPNLLRIAKQVLNNKGFETD
ncbi:MAG: hypothetical protein ACRCW0_00830 [Clostridium sp.]